MSEAAAEATIQPDPMEKFRELRDATLEIWSKNLIETVNSENYAQASGAALKNYLAAAAPFKEPAEQAMQKTLQQLNMPSAADFAILAGRFTNIEMQLDNLDAKLDRIEKALGLHILSSAAAATPKAPTPAKPAQAAPAAASRKQSAVRASALAKPAKAAKAVRRSPAKRTK
jgi:hypothetical protein